MNIFQELLRCQESFEHFCSYIKINHPVKGLIPFGMFDYQKRLIKHYEENRFTVLTKFRQGGFTTITMYYALWRCMFYENQKIMVTCKTSKEAEHIGRIISMAIDHLPKWLRPPLSQHTKSNMAFEMTDSLLLFRSSDSEAVRGIALTHLIIDEAAFTANMDLKWRALYPCVADGGKAIVLSTTNGCGGWFYDLYRDVGRKTNLEFCLGTIFTIFECDYLEHPDYQKPEWTKEIKKNLGPKAWRQEVLCEFVGEDYQWHTVSELLDYLTEIRVKTRDQKHKQALMEVDLILQHMCTSCQDKAKLYSKTS